MAFDGITVSALVSEFNSRLAEGRIYKIAQTESDELMITYKAGKTQHKMLISANASLPLAYFTENNKQAPLTAPNFCMLLRKHINSGRILSITQPGLERIIDFEIQHLDELGDVKVKHLIVELMGKHSNIIFTDDNNTIIDSIKHVTSVMSSVRQVLPGKPYFIPETMDKANPLVITREDFFNIVFSKPMALSKAIYTSFTGISPVVAEEICYLAGIDSSVPASEMSGDLLAHLYRQFTYFMEQVTESKFSPAIYYDGNEPKEFSSLLLTHFSNYQVKSYDSISEVIRTYYSSRDLITRIRQKSSDLRRVVQTALERNRKKYDLQLKQLRDTENRDKYKVYGELIHTYGYNLEEGAKELEALNYYTNEMIKIPLDPQKTPQENAKKYFDRYNKQKRTFEALSELIKETKDEIDYLESVSKSLDIARSEDDLIQIKEELIESGFIRRKQSAKKVKITSKPFHYISSDGFHMYVGKNNLQNEELTFHFANGGDWWFHAKKAPGSHVIVKTNGEELPDRTFEEAARLAAHYSKNSGAEKVEVDYVEKKQVKKPNGSKPGFVVYYTNYSMMIDSDISGIQEVQ